MKTVLRLILPALLLLLAVPLTATAAQKGVAAKKPKVIVRHFKAWEVRCAANAPKRCEMVQTVRRKSDHKPMARMIVAYAGSNPKPVAVFELPLGMRLPPGVLVGVDSHKATRLPVELCTIHNCRANMLLKPSQLAQLRAGHTARITIQAPNGRRLTLNASLMGFTSALKHITP